MQTQLTQKLIANPIQSDYLYLMWKGPDLNRYTVGKLYPDRFEYIDNKEAKDQGFNGYPAFNFEEPVHVNAVEVFKHRLPPSGRSNLNHYYKLYGLSVDFINQHKITHYQILGYTGAYLASDPFNFANPFEGNGCKRPFEFMIKAAAFSKYAKTKSLEALQAGKITIELEPSNPEDINAVRLLFNNSEHIGYVPRGYSKTFTKWIKEGYNITISASRINGTAESPDLYMFVELA